MVAGERHTEKTFQSMQGVTNFMPGFHPNIVDDVDVPDQMAQYVMV